MNKNKMKQEALKRMRKLDLIDDCIAAFDLFNEVWISEENGILFNLSKHKLILDKIHSLETQDNILVYHAIKTVTEYGTMVSLLCVCDNEDEWPIDWEDMNENLIFCYILNLTDEWCSEYGSIKFKKINGGLERTA